MKIKEGGGLRPPPSFILILMLCIISLYINILFKLIICLYICIYLCIFVYLCICVYICVHFCIFVYISVYSHLSSNDAPRDLLQNERLERSWGGLWLELWPFLYFRWFFIEIVVFFVDLVVFSSIFRRNGCFFMDVL